MRVGILVFDGVEELDAVGVYEVLAKAKQIHPQLDLTVRFRALKEQITGALGMKFLAHEVHRELSDLDLVIVPGGAGRAEVVQDAEFLKQLLDFGTEKPIASVCTGAIAGEIGVTWLAPMPAAVAPMSTILSAYFAAGMPFSFQTSKNESTGKAGRPSRSL